MYEMLGLGSIDGKLRHTLDGIVVALRQLYAFFLPVKYRRYEKVHPQRITVMGIDELAVLAVVLHARAYTTPHGAVGL